MSKTEEKIIEEIFKDVKSDKYHLEAFASLYAEPEKTVQQRKTGLTPEEAGRIAKQAITRIRNQYYTDTYELFNKIIKDLQAGLEIEDNYGWINRWSKRLFKIGLGIVIVDIAVAVAGVIIFYWIISQFINSIGIYASFAVLTSFPAIFTSFPAIVTSFPWPQLIAITGVIGAVGLGNIITTFIKGAFKEVRDCSVDSAQVKILFGTLPNQFNYLMSVLTYELDLIENKKTEEEKRKGLYDAYTKFFEGVTKMFKDLVNELQNYLQTPIKTEERKEEESKRLTALLKELIK